MLSKEDAMAIAAVKRNSLKIQNEIGFGDMNIKAPDIDFYPDGDQFFDSQEHEIHIGVFGILEMFEPSCEEEFMSALTFIRGHEEQHCRSTASVPYAWGVSRGMETVLEYISAQVEPSVRRFRSERDYRFFADNVLPGYGIYMNYAMLNNIIGGIANAVEDGRIERIRSKKFPGFAKLRLVYRGIGWDKQTDLPKYKDISGNPAERLRVIFNQILSLATCQVYQKGFAAEYAGTDLMKEVNELIPFITRAVLADHTREMAKQVIGISRILAPYLFEVCKLSAQDTAMRQALEKMIADIIKAAIDKKPGNTLSEQDEERVEGGTSALPMTDLCITLDDETYDKLMEKQNSSEEGTGGIMVRREHPKEEEKEEDRKENGQPSEGKGSEGGQSEKGKASSKSSGSDEESKDRNNGNEKTGSGSGKGKASERDNGQDAGSGSGASGEEGNDAKGKGREASDISFGNGEESKSPTGTSDDGADDGKGTEGKGGKKDSSKDAETSEKSKAKPSTSSAKQGSVKGKMADANGDLSMEEAVRAAMKEAAEEVNETARQDLENSYSANAKEINVRGKDVPDKAKPITAADVKDIVPNFRELKREYKLTERLPAVVAATGKTLYRKNQQYFRSLSTPNVSFLDSGSIDPSRIYSLAFGDTEIFRKKGKDKQFDGCAYILLDNSGSMEGKKRLEACKAAAAIEEGFRGLMPIKIVAFDYNGAVYHEVIKGWDEQNRLNCCWNFCVHGRTGWGNADGYDIQIATRELLARPERKKLLLVLSDGMPSGTTEEYVKGAISEARKNGIRVVGIYFEEGRVNSGEASAFAGMYQKNYIACPLDELAGNMVSEFKKFAHQ